MNFPKAILCGIIIGIGAVLPGVSGGVLAAVMGVYEPIMTSLSGFFKSAKKNFLFLLPYILGGGLSFLFFAGIIGKLMSFAPKKTVFFFSGLVIGGIPAFVKEANRDGFKFRFLFLSAAGFLGTLCIAPMISVPADNEFFKYILGGAVYSLGSLIPGVSASFLLINMGIYTELFSSLASPSVFIPFLIGFAPTSLLTIKAVSFVFTHYRPTAYYTVLGLLASSIVTALPALSHPVSELSLMTIGIICGFFFLNR